MEFNCHLSFFFFGSSASKTISERVVDYARAEKSSMILDDKAMVLVKQFYYVSL